jgi:hypothetical protein
MQKGLVRALNFDRRVANSLEEQYLPAHYAEEAYVKLLQYCE